MFRNHARKSESLVVAKHGIGCLLMLFSVLTLAGCQQNTDLGPVANAATSVKIREAFSAGVTESGSSESVVAAGTGWATIKGKFVFEGSPPEMAPYNANKDEATCKIDGKAPPQETLLVDSGSKGIANVVVFLRKTSRVHESAEPKADSVLFDQKACVFLTHVFPLTVGQTISIKNSDPVGHNTNIEGKNGFNQTIPANETVDFLPQKEEAIPQAIRCSIHPWMIAYYLPRKNSYFAVTAADGSFEISNVPAGEKLEFQVWHEIGTGPGGALLLDTPEAKELKWNKKGRFVVSLAEDEVREVQLTVPPTAFGG
ncbi:MAG: hypothetical protein GXP26_11835 [Planctomycetes bacterium]|nr:hypothetical protein [Planctomycetota bacterium]